MGALAKTNAQKYRHAKYACLILAYLYPLASNLFFVNYWNLEKINNEYLTTNLSFLIQFFYLINASRNTFLDAVVAASNNCAQKFCYMLHRRAMSSPVLGLRIGYSVNVYNTPQVLTLYPANLRTAA